MAGKKMAFSVVHHDTTKFKSGGLRAVFEYRDLGINKATGGKFGAHLIRVAQPGGAGTGLHRHKLNFQMIYITKGWAIFRYKGHGTHKVEAGSCVHQPPGIEHDLVQYSNDLEILEIVSPHDFKTEDAGNTAKKAPARKTAARKTAAKKPAARKPAAKRTAARKATAKKAPARKTAARKTAAKKPAAKKTAARKPATRKPAARKTASRRTTTRR